MEYTERDQDIVAIQQIVADAEKLQSDLEGFTGLLTDDVVIVNFGGRRVRGKNEIYQAMKQALATPLADVITRHELEDIRFLRPDVALVGLVKHVSDQRESSGEPLQEKGRLTWVLVKEQGTWLIASAQTTPIKG